MIDTSESEDDINDEDIKVNMNILDLSLEQELRNGVLPEWRELKQPL